MNRPQTACALALFFLLFATISSCKKDDENTNPNNPNPNPTPDTELATVSTDKIENISYDSAQVFSTVSKEGKSAVLAMGIAWGKNPNPTVVSDNSIPYASFGVGTFRTSLRNLELGTTYFVRSYATNAVGTAYSEQKSFSTKGGTAPTLTTLAVTNIKLYSASSGGDVSVQGSSAVVERGIVWSTAPGPTLGVPGKAIAPTGGTGSFTLQMTGLTHNTQYYVRAYATNGQDTNYGNEQIFTTLTAVAPTISTLPMTSIYQTTAVSGVSISNVGSSSILERGIVWSTSSSPTIGAAAKAVYNTSADTGTFYLKMTGLTHSTQYYVRAFATNGEITKYGNEQSFFTLPPPPPVTDIDGNIYPTVQIESKIFMKTNLKTSRFRDGSTINSNLDSIAWSTTTSGAYAIYDNNLYGKLYNWYAVSDPRGLCPVGWHVPTDQECNLYLGVNLFYYTGGNNGGKLKAMSSLWQSPNLGATDESGFSGLPGGYRSDDYSTSIFSIGTKGRWWTSTINSTNVASGFELQNDRKYTNIISYLMRSGLSVRCIKD